ncbi:MAG: PilZ domain-containing protein [Candidatus Omnitrophota bacterium]
MGSLDLATMTRRVCERYRLDGSATLVGENGIEEPSILRDLSCRGAGIVTSQPLRPNDKLNIVIHPSFLFGRPVAREARVAWCNRISSGLWQGGLDFGEHKISLS